MYIDILLLFPKNGDVSSSNVFHVEHGLYSLLLHNHYYFSLLLYCDWMINCTLASLQ
jgi:hypothetical protein